MIVLDVIVVEVRISQHIYNAVNYKYVVNSDYNGNIWFYMLNLKVNKTVKTTFFA